MAKKSKKRKKRGISYKKVVKKDKIDLKDYSFAIFLGIFITVFAFIMVRDNKPAMLAPIVILAFLGPIPALIHFIFKKRGTLDKIKERNIEWEMDYYKYFSKNKSLNTKTPWIFKYRFGRYFVMYSLIFLTIASVILLITIFIFTMKSMVDGMTYVGLGNHAIGTVTTAIYDGEHMRGHVPVKDFYHEIEYVISFDHEVNGLTEYHYHAYNKTDAPYFEGSRHMVIFNNSGGVVIVSEFALIKDAFFFVFVIMLIFLLYKYNRLYLYPIRYFIDMCDVWFEREAPHEYAVAKYKISNR